MDRFKFRGKRRDNGELVYGSLVINNVGQHYIVTCPAMTEGDVFHIVPESTEQCTGLKDKNGTLIYEGDRLEFQEDYGEDGRVVRVIWCGDDSYPAFDVFPNDVPEINGLSHMLGTGVVTIVSPKLHEATTNGS